MTRTICLLVSSLALFACGESGQADNSIKTQLSVTATLGEFDVEHGQVFLSTVYVEIDGQHYPLEAAPGADFRGFEGLSRMELGGRRARVAGEIINGIYVASYAELLSISEPEIAALPPERLAEYERLMDELSLAEADLLKLEEQRQALQIP